ncbi:hypothetical protein EniLVp02_0053 [Vibrio phage EniLVp02]
MSPEGAKITRRRAIALRKFCDKLLQKYLPSNMPYEFVISLDKHITDRMWDRCIHPRKVSRLLTHLVKYHLCEVLWYAEAKPAIRLAIMDEDDNYLMIGATTHKYDKPDGTTKYVLRLRSVYYERNRTRLIEQHVIRINDNELYPFKTVCQSDDDLSESE